MKKKLALLMILTIATPIWAAVIPSSSPHDDRIRTVEYNPRDVIVLDGMIGIATHIQLESGERYVDHVFGDSAGWHFAENANHVFLKPKAEHSSSNLVLITDRRVYYFELRYSDAFETGTRMFGVSFTYPDTQAAQALADAERRRVRDGFNSARPINANYTMTGKRSLAPINAWDNRQFTFFRFPGAVDVPAIFMVNPDGTESIVNHHVEGPANDIVVVHKVAAQWVLRLGRDALSIFNESYDPIGESNTSRTASPEVVREVRGSDQ